MKTSRHEYVEDLADAMRVPEKTDNLLGVLGEIAQECDKIPNIKSRGRHPDRRGYKWHKKFRRDMDQPRRLKYIRRQAARAVRRQRFDGQGNSYKRVFDVPWTLW